MNLFVNAIARTLAQATGLPAEEIAPLVESPKQESFGDYAFPCFTLSKQLRKAPPLIAKELSEKLELPPEIERAVPVGPYINFYLDRELLARTVINDYLKLGPSFGAAKPATPATVVLDYSSPNVYKPLGVHHLRSTMIGHAVANIFRSRGWNVVGINYLGDWGTTFGQLMVAYDWHRKVYEGRRLSTQDMLTLYTEFHRRVESEPGLADQARNYFKRLEDGDADVVALWEHIKAEGLKDFETIYKRLGVSFEVYSGESVYNKKMADSLARLKAKGLAVESQGAVIVDLEKWDLAPCLLQKSDGATTYALRDIAAAEDRFATYHFDLMLYVVAQQQRLHFQQIFKVLELMGYDWAARCRHVDFGMLSFSGEKFSTRQGNIIFLDEVLDRAVEIAAGIIEAKNPDLENKREVAETVGAGAIVFDDFRQRRSKDIVFDWKEALNFDGETGPYLQYTYVRLGGILAKFAGTLPDRLKPELLTTDEEAKLLRMVGEFDQTLDRAAGEFEPSLVARYLLDIAAAFNNFYQKHRVLGDDPDLTAARITLVKAVRQVIGRGLEILGLGTPEKM